jgi:hypothetical protein
MVYAAYAWARREGLGLSDKSVPFKNEAGFVKNLYAGLSFFAQQYCSELAAQAAEEGSVPLRARFYEKSNGQGCLGALRAEA